VVLTVLSFYAFAALTIVGSLVVVGQRTPMYSVLALILSFVGLSGLYIGLEAPFVAMVQIIIYAGAIMVLFLFVVMLLNARREDTIASPAGAKVLGVATAAVLGLQLIMAARAARSLFAIDPAALGPAPSSVREIGNVLFTDYAFAFEVTSVLILVAMVGAVVLARREP